tara:strand:- start:6930 stop:7460 length:531 start_codon:yes stop_codon:yes gene_type:complete
MIYGKYDIDGNWKAYSNGILPEWSSEIVAAFPELAGKEVLESAKKSDGVYDIICNTGSSLVKYKNMYPFTKYRVDVNSLSIGTESYFRGVQLAMPQELSSYTIINEDSLISSHYTDSVGLVEYSVNIRPTNMSGLDFSRLATMYSLDTTNQNVAAILVKWSDGVAPWGELYLYLSA